MLWALAATALMLLGGIAAAAPGAPGADAGRERVEVIVTLRDAGPSPAVQAQAQAEELDGEVVHTYSTVLRGYSVRLPERAIAALQRNPRVERVERVVPVRATATQSDPPSGVDRIDQRSLPLDGSYSYAATGSGVRAYIVDTGIRTNHADFGTRASAGYSAINDGRGAADCNGHGTHVAGSLGGSRWGVAKEARLVAVRVLDCEGEGTSSTVLAGVDYIARTHVPGQPAVAVLSLGGPPSTVLDDAARQLISRGVTVTAAAGNETMDACSVSPARVDGVLTVGATDAATDVRAGFSNYGDCIDLFAPGLSVRSAYYTGSTATAVLSGTSMAAPHVAGAAALHLETEPTASPARVFSVLRDASTKGVVGDSRSANNDLLFSPRRESAGPSPVEERYTALGGASSFLGSPVSDELPTSRGDGLYRHYNGGSIFWSRNTPASVVLGAIRGTWSSLGWERSALGYPTTDERGTADGRGRFNHFQVGSIFWTPSTGAREVRGAIRDTWGSLGWERSALGYPTTNELWTPDRRGRFNHFQVGSIYWTPSTGAREVRGAIRDTWGSLGWERSALGYPTTNELGTPDGRGRFNHFQVGSIYWTPSTGAREVRGAIRGTWSALGWERSALGYPTTNELGTPDGRGRYNHFQVGSIYWTPSTGAREVRGAIRARWAGLGWERSFLGYPTSNEYAVPGGRASNFQGGRITWNAATGGTSVTRS